MTAFVVPDEETWLAAGAEGLDPGAESAVEPSHANVLLLPERVPTALVDAVRLAWSRMPPGKELRTYTTPLAGVPAQEAVRHAAEGESAVSGHGEEDHGEDEGGHSDGHDHEDMMAITGEPSADGLVMEDLEVVAGPLGFAIAGGLVVTASLDGDVIADCEVRQTLECEDAHGAPQPDAAYAWHLAQLSASERTAGVAAGPDRLLQIASLELERAVSHIAWLHRFGRQLAWQVMTARSRALLRALVEIRAALPAEPDAADVPAASAERTARLGETATLASDLARELAASRRLAGRTRGVGCLSQGDADARGLAGPAARSSGVARDAREGDPAYAALGFEPTLERDGDARARTLVRVREAAQSLELALHAFEMVRSAGADAEALAQAEMPAGVIEGPRGPLRVGFQAPGAVAREAPGARAAAAAAGELARGREWAAGLVTVASFDLSPWRVGA